ncbi:MAG: DUF2071 domain-containing protein [bacterium]
MSKNFLTAEWRKLIMVNYKVSQDILLKYLPAKTEMDFFQGNCYVSLVGFMFLNVKVKGFSIPFHKNFEEVNLRFYVRHEDKNTHEVKRGVVFIKEIVPKSAISFIANNIYKEKYETMKMSHDWKMDSSSLNVQYRWLDETWNKLKVIAEKSSEPIISGSEEEFITEHYWGYTRIDINKTSEYNVQHPKWNIYKVRSYEIDADFKNLYGNEFDFLSREVPATVFLAEGSEISVGSGRML